MPGPSSRKPRISGPFRCGQRLWIAYTRSSTRNSAISTPPACTTVRPRSPRSASRATATQLPASGGIAPQTHDGLPVGGMERAVLGQRVDAVAGALEVRRLAGEVAPAGRVLRLDDPGEAALDDSRRVRVVAEDAGHDH